MSRLPGTLLRYVRDRRGIILTYYAGVLLSILVLALAASRGGLVSPGDVLYGLGLSTVLLGAYLGYDFRRQARFLSDLQDLLSPGSRMEDAAAISEPATNEQRTYRDVLAASVARFRESLAGYKRTEEFHRRFADRWVHHIKTPVSVMKLLVEQLSSSVECGPKRLLEIADSMQQENERLQRSLDTFLNSVRLEAFESDLRFEQIDLVDLARESFNAHKSELIGSSVFPKLIVSTPETSVATDRKWMRFVLDQLITNAVKYSGPAVRSVRDARQETGTQDTCSSKTLAIEVQADGDSKRLTVRDEGIGIPPEDIPRIFEPFFTGQNGRLVPESTGMGLYFVRQVLARLGHTVEVQSAVGRGTAITITFSSGSIADAVLSR